MDSTLGKLLSSILGLLALAGVAVLGYYGMAHHKTDSAVADVATLAVNVRATYVNNPNGYASLTNAVAVGAGAVPASMLQDGHVVNAWGSSVTLGPVPGYPKDFYIDLGQVPQPACVQLLTTEASLMGAQVGGISVELPVAAQAAASACAEGGGAPVAMSLQYGQSKLPVCLPGQQVFSTFGAYSFTMRSGCKTLTIWAWGAGGGTSNGNNGGSTGGFAGGSFSDMTPGTTFRVIVGQGGSTSASPTFGGGAGGGVGPGGYQGGSGGGASVVADGAGNDLVVAAGGGGGGYGTSPDTSADATPSGPGPGGAGGTCPNGSPGVGDEGGAGAAGAAGGGGGGGYFGGGGGGGFAFRGACSWGYGGGAGYGYVNPALSSGILAASKVQNNGVMGSNYPPNPVGYAGVDLPAGPANASVNQTYPGGNGLVLFRWGP